MPHVQTAQYLTVGAAASLLGVSPKTLRNWDKAGKLKPGRHPKNGYRIYRREDLDVLVKGGGFGMTTKSESMATWMEVGDTEHFVQFYESDAYLIESMCGYLGAAVAVQDAAIVIATEAHRNALREALDARGVDCVAAIAEDRLVLLDAAETLTAFMVDGTPDPARFAASVGSVVARMSRPPRRLRAFGEMVAILWAEGNRSGAIELESLWNQLAKFHAFSLFCAYPMGGFADASSAADFREVCTCHTRVIPGEHVQADWSHRRRMRAIAELQQKARSLEAEIAHRAEVENALAGREEELSDFLENAGEGIHRVSADGTILWANKAELEMLGYEPHEYVGRHIAEFHDDSVAITDIMDRLRRGENVNEHPATLRCRNGDVKHVRVNCSPCFKDGQFLHARCFVRDVTERKAAENTTALLAAIVDSSDDAIISKTLEGVITSWNRGAERIFGYAADEVVGRPIEFLFPPDLVAEEHEILSRLGRGERIDHYETQRCTREGRRIDVSLTISPVRDAEGRIVGISKIARDITERKKMDRSLRELNATLERRVAERTAEAVEQSSLARELASQVALTEQRERRRIADLLHDGLAQSLAMAKLKLTTLEMQFPQTVAAPPLQSVKQVLAESIQFTRSLMNDLAPPMLYDSGLSAAVMELAGRLQAQHGFTVTVNATNRLPIPDDVRAFLFQAVRELLTNAIKYGSTDHATVTITKTPERVVVTVEDEGAGFDLATLPARSSDQRGFGLFNIRERAGLLGGRFTIESEPGRGTRCRIDVPMPASTGQTDTTDTTEATAGMTASPAADSRV